LGDLAANAPSSWQWGRPDDQPHLLVMLYAREGKLEEWKQTVVRILSGSGLTVLRCLSTAVVDGYEPFCLKDGLRPPGLDWNQKREVCDSNQLAYGNIVALGEFLLGYANEYGQYTASPTVDAASDRQSALLPATDQPSKRDLGRNGTYLVLRDLRQDVHGFWQFLEMQSGSDPAIMESLAEAMVGRKRDGAPLVPISDRPIAGIEGKHGDVQRNQFTFDSDQEGVDCPLGAHIRRANPRNSDLPGGPSGFVGRLLRMLGFCRDGYRWDTIASARFHRIVRRGRKYGQKLTPEQVVQQRQPDGEERGLYFICINANIERQFEFIQSAWIMNTKFNGLSDESDPLLGNREPIAGSSAVDTFSLPKRVTLRHRMTGIPQFVTVRGGAYFFLPSIRALRYLASLSG